MEEYLFPFDIEEIKIDSKNNKEIMEYILSKHIGKAKYDPCILHFSNYLQKWQLIPLSQYFEKSTEDKTPGKQQREHYFLEEINADDSIDHGTEILKIN